MLFSKVLAGASVIHGASAAALNPGGIVGQLECIAVAVVVKSLSLVPTATPFCSSFLGIQTSTVTKTSTTTLPTVTLTSTKTVSTTTITPAPVISTVTSTSTYTQCSPTPAMGNVRKRQINGLPAPLAAFQSAQISTACSCLRLTTPTSTVTSTVTQSPSTTITTSVTATVNAAPVTSTTTVTETTTTSADVCPTPTMCDNGGLQYGVFYNPQGSSRSSGYPTFDPTYLKTDQQDFKFNGTINPPGYILDSCDNNNGRISVYGGPDIPCRFFTVDHRGYFFTPITGDYTFYSRNLDDIALFWSGPVARAGWNRGNADHVAAYQVSQNGGPQSSAKTTITLQQGQYLPIRVVYANAQGAAGYDFAVVDPNGTLIICSQMASFNMSPYLVQNSCDGVQAPPFPGTFGSEP